VSAITTVAVGTFAALVAYSRPHVGAGHAVIVGCVAWLICAVAIASASWRDRLTTLGATLAARWTQEQSALAATPAAWTLGAEALQQRAFAVALSVPGAGIGPPGRPLPASRLGRVAVDRPSEVTRPSQAWSSFTGSWRLVKIRSATRLGMTGGGAMLAGAAIFGLISVALGVGAGQGPWALLIGTVAAALGIGGVAILIRVSAIPRRLTFDGQVIARWSESDDSDSPGRTPYFAVDDGVKAWAFSGGVAQVALEDLVNVTVNPRNGSLINLTVMAHQRPETPVEATIPKSSRPAEPLLSTVEVAELIGPVSRTTAIPSLGGYGTVYRGRDGSLSLTVASGGIANFNTMISRNAGTPLPGVGDAAWVLNAGRTVIVRVGEQVAKITASGQGVERRPDLLARAAAAVAARLSEQAGPAGAQQAGPAAAQQADAAGVPAGAQQAGQAGAQQAGAAGGAQAATWPGADSPASPAW
jgi:hypothetical protein